MTKLTLNREFALRYLFVVLVFLGMGGWFGYDGLVRYPSMTGAQLYVSIEKSDPAPGTDLEAFKRQKVQAQLGLMAALLVAAAWVLVVLLRARAFAFAFGKDGFVWRGKRYAWSDVSRADRRQWAKKGVLRLGLGDGASVTLDAWHHDGVKECEALLAASEAARTTEKQP